jgi:hypothetical protein
MYTNGEHEDTMKAFKEYVKSRKATTKHKHQDSATTAILSQNVKRHLHDFVKGEELKSKIDSDSLEQIKAAESELLEVDNKYHETKGRKWIVMLIGTALFAGLGFYLMPKLYALTHSSYDRKGIESICERMFGNVNIDDALTDEVMIVSFEYNSHTPRLFTKWFAKQDNATFNVSLAQASEASSAAPMYFDPKTIGSQVLIDGGVIANEPAFYAYVFSAEVLNRTSIRVVSIGTGIAQPATLDVKSITLVTWLELATTFITTVAQNT